MKRVLSIQDISCVGKCSLTVALPILSAAGLETAILPTAVLSTHTAFREFTFRDLTDDLQKIADVWKRENIAFSGIYTGYLGSFRQIEIVKNFMKSFKKNDTLMFVDPAMADNGVMYKGFTPDFAIEMSKLCSVADIIVPNITEAKFMLDCDFPLSGYSENQTKDLLKRLCGLGCKKAILTGVKFDDKHCGAAAYCAETDEYITYFSEYIPVSFHGTGDVFSSALFGALMNNKSLAKSLEIAVKYTVKSIQNTISYSGHVWYGVDFESALPVYLKLLEKI